LLEFYKETDLHKDTFVNNLVTELVNAKKCLNLTPQIGFVTGRDNMKTFSFDTDAPNLIDPYLRELGVKFVRDRINSKLYTYMVDLEPSSPHIASLTVSNALKEVTEIPENFKRILLVDRVPHNQPPKEKREPAF